MSTEAYLEAVLRELGVIAQSLTGVNTRLDTLIKIVSDHETRIRALETGKPRKGRGNAEAA